MVRGTPSRVEVNSTRRDAAPPEMTAVFNSNPALQLPQHELAYHVHAGFAVIEAGDEGKLLAAIVLEDLGILLRNLFQSLKAIGGETRREHRDPAHTRLAQPLHGLVGVGLQPFV